MNLKNKKVLVAGTGISGLGAAKLLRAAGARVICMTARKIWIWKTLKSGLLLKDLSCQNWKLF